MKVPLRYQNTEYDCGTTSFINALAYLYDREDGFVGKGGTSLKHAEMLARYFEEYANNNKDFNINCKVLSKDKVNLNDMKKTLDNHGVIIARCWQTVEHYVLITKIDNYFDSYYLEEDYYYEDEENKDFSLLKEADREVILINR